MRRSFGSLQILASTALAGLTAILVGPKCVDDHIWLTIELFHIWTDSGPSPIVNQFAHVIMNAA